MAKKNAAGDAVTATGEVAVALQPGPVLKNARGDVIPNTAGALAPQPSNKAWGSEGIHQSDIVIPKLLLMQPLSKFVEEEKAQAGDVVRSTTAQKLVGDMLFIPLTTFKTWVVEEQIKGKFEFRGVVPVTASNADAPLEWEEGGTKWQRSRVLNFYVLLPGDIEREAMARAEFDKSGDLPDTNDALLPYLISFRRTSYKAGKELITHFAKAAHFNVPPASKTFALKVRKEKNDKGFYFVFGVEGVGKTPPDNLAVAKRWYDTLKTANVTIHEEGEAVDTASERAVAAASPAVEPGQETF